VHNEQAERRAARGLGENMAKLMGAVALCLAAGFGFAAPCAASSLNVKTLEHACKSENTTLKQMCFSYILGTMDSFEATSSLYGTKIPFCYPKGGLSPEDVILVFRLWASTNPTEQDRPAISGIIISMIERFPCPK
jgi:hypothetical protein